MGKHRKTVASLMSLIAVLNLAFAQDFAYDGDKGPSHWGEHYNTCFGKFQSPIDIDSLAVKRAKLPRLQFHDYVVPSNQTIIKNNGHTVVVSIDSEKLPTISGGPLIGTYEFSQLHFHWGQNDTLGSEDLIDGHSFPMELHVVFYKKDYRSVRSALENNDGLTVLAFFFNLDRKDNANYKEITELLSKVSEPEKSIPFNHLHSIQDLMLPDLDDYYTYHGSLTTPPCSEVVTWIDFKQSITLSRAQIAVFRSLQDHEGHLLTHNFRPTQPVGDRDVYYVSSMGNSANVDDDDLFTGYDPGLDEPSQHLTQINSNYKHDILTEQTTYATNNVLDSDGFHEQNGNSIELETTTTTTVMKHGKFNGKSSANRFTQNSYWLLIGIGTVLFIKIFEF